jgi:hypothetical protein
MKASAASHIVFGLGGDCLYHGRSGAMGGVLPRNGSERGTSGWGTGGCVESRMAEVFATCCGVNLAGATAGVSALSGFWGLPVLGSCWAGTQGNAGYRIAFFASAQSTVTLIGDPWNPHRWRSNSGNAKVGHWQTGIENFGCIHVQTSGILASAPRHGKSGRDGVVLFPKPDRGVLRGAAQGELR